MFCLFLTEPWVGLQCVIVASRGHSCSLFMGTCKLVVTCCQSLQQTNFLFEAILCGSDLGQISVILLVFIRVITVAKKLRIH